MPAERNASMVHLRLEEGYRFTVDFGDGLGPLTMDEPPPLGGAEGPNASAVLGAAVGNCLSASLAYCLRRAHLDVVGLSADVEVAPQRDERGRLRIGSVQVHLRPVVDGGGEGRLTRCLELFEDFCVVTASVRRGIPVEVRVDPEVLPTSGTAHDSAEEGPA